MQVTFTNASGSAVYLSAIYSQLAAGQSVTTRRTQSQLEAEQQLKAYVQAGTITLSFALETGDSAALGSAVSLPSYTNITRPAANTVPTFSCIWSVDDNATIWSDGIQWRDNDGNIT